MRGRGLRPAFVSCALLAASLFAGPGWRTAHADDAAPVPVASPNPAVDPGWSDDATAYVRANGDVQRIVKPEFRSVVALKADLDAMGFSGAAVVLIAPFVPVPPEAPNKPPPPPVPSRMLVSGSPDLVADALAHIQRLDVPPRQVLVSMLISEVSCDCVRGSGATWRIDKGAIDAPDDALFRGFASEFDPDSYLVSELSGARPFEGTTLDFGDMKFLGAAWEATFRMLMKQRRAELFSWPKLLCTEGEEAKLIAIEQLVVPFAERTWPDHATSTKTEVVGIQLKVFPERVGEDSAVIQLELWIREPEALEAAGSRPLSVGMNVRRVTTQVTLRDGEPLLLGGLYRRRLGRIEKGIPVIQRFTLLDVLTGARDSHVIDTELLFLIRADIQRLAQPDPDVRFKAWPDPLRDAVFRIPDRQSIDDVWRQRKRGSTANEEGPARERAGPGSIEGRAPEGAGN